MYAYHLARLRASFSESRIAAAILESCNSEQSGLKWYYDQKIISFFLPILKAYSLNIQLAKF